MWRGGGPGVVAMSSLHAHQASCTCMTGNLLQQLICTLAGMLAACGAREMMMSSH